VAQSGHGRQRRGLSVRERAHGFISVQQRVEMIEVHGNRLWMILIFAQLKPLHDIALDGVGNVVHGIGAVGEAKVDDGRDLGLVAVAVPEKI